MGKDDKVYVPKDVIIKDKVDLRKKLEDGIKDTDNGNVCSLDEAFNEINTMLER